MIFSSKEKGFTIVELVVSVAIFAFMTSFLVSKYGTFNQSVLLTNLAYDVALTIRNAQMYGLNVKSKPTNDAAYSLDDAGFQYGYGVHFTTETGQNNKMIFFADAPNGTLPPDGIYTAGEEISTFSLKNGNIISKICVGPSEASCSVSNSPSPYLDVSFRRPDPNAIIREGRGAFHYAEITVKASNNQTKRVSVRRTGQIAVLHNN